MSTENGPCQLLNDDTPLFRLSIMDAQGTPDRARDMRGHVSRAALRSSTLIMEDMWPHPLVADRCLSALPSTDFR